MAESKKIKLCTVRGQWTTAISAIDTTCRFFRRADSTCTHKKRCEYKTTNPLARFIGKRVKTIDKGMLVFDDGSILGKGLL